jgi:hypothetical protein
VAERAFKNFTCTPLVLNPGPSVWSQGPQKGAILFNYSSWESLLWKLANDSYNKDGSIEKGKSSLEA